MLAVRSSEWQAALATEWGVAAVEVAAVGVGPVVVTEAGATYRVDSASSSFTRSTWRTRSSSASPTSSADDDNMRCRLYSTSMSHSMTRTPRHSTIRVQCSRCQSVSACTRSHWLARSQVSLRGGVVLLRGRSCWYSQYALLASLRRPIADDTSPAQHTAHATHVTAHCSVRLSTRWRADRRAPAKLVSAVFEVSLV